MSAWVSPSKNLPEDERDVVVKCVDRDYGREGHPLYLDHNILTGKYVKGYGWLIYGADDWFGAVDVELWCDLPPLTEKE